MALGEGRKHLLVQRPSQSVTGAVTAHVADIEGLIAFGSGCRDRLIGRINEILSAGAGDIGHYLGPGILLGIRCAAKSDQCKNKKRYLFHIQR